MKKYAFFLAVLCALTVTAAVGNPIDAVYRITPDIEDGILRVHAEFSGLRAPTVRIGFRTVHYSNGKTIDLSRRISSFRTETPGTAVRLIGTCAFEIDTGGVGTLAVAYDFDTRGNPYSHEITALTGSTLHMPGLDFFARVDEPDVNADGAWVNVELSGDDLGYGSIGSHRVTIENMPPGWKILSTYRPVSPDTVYVDDGKAVDILLSAGTYETAVIERGEASFTVAVDGALGVDAAAYAEAVGNFVDYFLGIYGSVNRRNILLVVNRGESALFGVGGQEKDRNIVVGMSGDDIFLKAMEKDYLRVVAHELSHLWLLFQAFNVKEDCYWFSEGMSDYLSHKALLKTGLVAEAEFSDNLAFAFMTNNIIAGGLRENLVEASLSRHPTAQENSLRYNKGAYVAYLVDRKLRESGRGIEAFLGDFYRDFALTGRELDNRTLIGYLSSYLGDGSIAERYVLGTGPIPSEDVRGFHRFVLGRISAIFSALPIAWKILVPVLATVLTAILVLAVLLTVKTAVRLGRKAIASAKSGGGAGIARTAAVTAGGIALVVGAAVLTGVMSRPSSFPNVSVSPQPYSIEALNSAGGVIDISFEGSVKRKVPDSVATSISWNDDQALSHRFVWKSDRLLSIEFNRVPSPDTTIYFKFDGFRAARGTGRRSLELEYR